MKKDPTIPKGKKCYKCSEKAFEAQVYRKEVNDLVSACKQH